jgi:hypothetical protein
LLMVEAVVRDEGKAIYNMVKYNILNLIKVGKKMLLRMLINSKLTNMKLTLLECITRQVEEEDEKVRDNIAAAVVKTE